MATNHGGERDNAGAKRLPEDLRSSHCSLQWANSTISALDALADKNGLSRTAQAEIILREVLGLRPIKELRDEFREGQRKK